MKKVAILTLLALAAAVSSCGTRTPTTTVETTTSGNWEAQLVGGIGPASQLNFVTQFTLDNVNGVSEPFYPAGSPTGFSFINLGPCFVSTNPPTGTASLNTNSANQVTGSMTFTVTSATPPGNTLTLTTGTSGGVSGTASGTPGTVLVMTNGVVWGGWTLSTTNSSSGCTGIGTFLMCQSATTCTVP
ncbi:MAG: hypothetical protein ABSE40_04460 [Candidatus Sulfotelmatobacter sp.]|jgi:hypothetical protein